MDAARRALPRHLRRRAHRHRPRPRSSRSTTSTRRWPRSASSTVENPLEFGIVITREDGSIERFLEKPTWGQVFSDTINTGIFVLEPEIFDYIAAGPAGRLLQRGVPRSCSPTGKPLFGAVADGLLGGRRHARGLRPRPQGRARRQGRSVDIPGFELDRRRVAGRGRRGPPRRRRSTGPAVIGDDCRVEAGARLGEYTVLGTQRAGARRRRPRAHRASTTTPTSARACGSGARWSAGPCDLRSGRPLRGGRRARRRVLRRRERACSARA